MMRCTCFYERKDRRRRWNVTSIIISQLVFFYFLFFILLLRYIYALNLDANYTTAAPPKSWKTNGRKNTFTRTHEIRLIRVPLSHVILGSFYVLSSKHAHRPLRLLTEYRQYVCSYTDRLRSFKISAGADVFIFVMFCRTVFVSRFISMLPLHVHIHRPIVNIINNNYFIIYSLIIVLLI